MAGRQIGGDVCDRSTATLRALEYGLPSGTAGRWSSVQVTDERTIRHRVADAVLLHLRAVQLGIVGWQTHGEARAFGFISLVAGVAMVGFGKGFDDRQAQTCSLRRPSGWRITSVELGE